MKLSIIIPVYKTPKLAGDIVNKLLKNTYEDKEIFIIIDGQTNTEIEEALMPFKDRINLMYNNAQLGKAKSLNNIALTIPGEILVFFDNDILLSDDSEFLSHLAQEFVKHDLVEFPKEAVTKSLISKILGFEFLSYAIASYSFASISNRCPSMNGAAFAIKQELFKKLNGFSYVMNEDMDMASRAFLLHAKFSYNPKLKVYNTLPETFKDWLVQRKRWAINNVLWLKNNFLLIIKNFFKDSKFRTSFALIALPSILYILLSLIMHYLGLTPLLPLLTIIGMHQQLLLGILLILQHYHLFIGGIIPVLLGLFFTVFFNFIFSKVLKFKFNPFIFIFFYFLYIPIWMLANIIYGIVVIMNFKVKLDWKITT